MRILLAQNSPYFPAAGGGDKSNRLLLEALAARGHECRAVARSASYGPEAHRSYLKQLSEHSIQTLSTAEGVAIFELGGVEVHVVTSHANLRGYFASQLEAFQPEAILSSTDDPAQLLLEASLRAGSGRNVYLARATLALPFGPDCAFPSAAKTDALRRMDRVVGVSQYVADYIRKWAIIEALHVPISLMEPGPYPELGRFTNEFVTLVNPCAVKGLAIFLALVDAYPGIRFAAVPMWGTNENDRAALASRPNIDILPTVEKIDELLARTRVLLVPSLWAEARSRIVVEAMLRGVPVIASDVGGIPEAKMGVDYLLPVRPIEKYQPRVDEQMVPVADVPEQDIGPWQHALERLTSDREHYEAISFESRQAALRYTDSLSVARFESLLEEVLREPKREPVPAAEITPERRRLLALRLKQQRAPAGNPWFPILEMRPGAKLRLFAFPSAGGGASAFRGWSDGLPATVSLCPVRLPGRESRLGEPPIDRMDTLIEALAEAIRKYLDKPFAFLGHSMGAAIAFELARALRERKAPAVAGLFVSAARAPKFRLGHVPGAEPEDADFLAELRRLQGVPAEVLDRPELLRVILPALRADARLYRNYVYIEGPPVDCPIAAYGGTADPNLRREHLEAWREHTSARFSLRMFEGGHFFPDTRRAEFLTVLSEDLEALCGAF